MAESIHLVICAFDAAARANEAKRAVQQLDAELDAIKLGNIAIVSKNEAGEVVFRETDDRRAKWGTVAGEIVGSVTWLLYDFAGMLGPVAGPLAGEKTKAAVNRFAADGGFPDETLRAIGERLDAGHAAIIVLVAAGDAQPVIDRLKQLGGHIATHELPADLVAALVPPSSADAPPNL